VSRLGAAPAQARNRSAARKPRKPNQNAGEQRAHKAYLSQQHANSMERTCARDPKCLPDSNCCSAHRLPRCSYFREGIAMRHGRTLSSVPTSYAISRWLRVAAFVLGAAHAAACAHSAVDAANGGGGGSYTGAAGAAAGAGSGVTANTAIAGAGATAVAGRLGVAGLTGAAAASGTMSGPQSGAGGGQSVAGRGAAGRS